MRDPAVQFNHGQIVAREGPEKDVEIGKYRAGGGGKYCQASPPGALWCKVVRLGEERFADQRAGQAMSHRVH